MPLLTAARKVMVTGPGAAENLYGPNPAPGGPTDPNRFSVGNQFIVSAAGQISAIKHWRHGGVTSRYVQLWKLNAGGSAWDKVGEATTTEPVTGWITTQITPVPVVAGNVFRVAYGYDGQVPGNSFAYNNNTVPGSAHLTWQGGVYSTPTMAVDGEKNFPDNIIQPNHYFGDVVFSTAAVLPATAVYAKDKKVWPPGPPVMDTSLVTWLDADSYIPGSWPNKGVGPAISIVTGSTGQPMPVSTTTQNGHQVVRFIVSEARVRSTFPYPVDDWTLLYLMRWVGPSTVGRAWTVCYPPSNLLVGTHTTGQDTMYDNGIWLGPNTGGAAAWGIPPGPWKMYEADSDSTGQMFYINGVTYNTRYQPGPGQGLSNGWGLSGYDWINSSETFDFEVAELVLYNRRLTDPERIATETYLRGKWGL